MKNVKMIAEALRDCIEYKFCDKCPNRGFCGPDCEDLFIKAADTIENLIAENIRLKRRKSHLTAALAKMLFAYTNKDADNPHQFEIKAVRCAKELLKNCKKSMPELLKQEGTLRDNDNGAIRLVEVEHD